MYRKLILLIFAACFFISATSQDNKPLFEAVEKNDIETLKKLLDQGANPNAIDEYGDAILMNAALYASVDCMKLLLDKGANPNYKNKEGLTCLMFCVHEQEKVRLLLSKSVDINVSGKSGNTPLLVAAVGYNSYDIVKLLIENGADPLATNKLKETALIRAIPFCDAKMISLLLEKGNPIDSVALSGTALTVSILYSNGEAALSLLEKGADPNVADSFGSPLGAAVLFNDTAVTYTLIRRTKDINALDVEGISPLAWVGYNEHDRPDYAQALIDRGANVHQVFKNGSTPLSWALKKGNTKTVEVLKKAGAKK